MSPRIRVPKPRPIPEKVVQAQIVALLKQIGAAVYVLGTRRPAGDFQGTRQSPGIPDLHAFLPARQAQRCVVLWVEVKATGGRLSDDQAAFQALCVAANIAHVVGGLDDVIAWLIRFGYLTESQVPHYRLPAEAPLSTLRRALERTAYGQS